MKIKDENNTSNQKSEKVKKERKFFGKKADKKPKNYSETKAEAKKEEKKPVEKKVKADKPKSDKPKVEIKGAFSKCGKGIKKGAGLFAGFCKNKRAEHKAEKADGDMKLVKMSIHGIQFKLMGFVIGGLLVLSLIVTIFSSQSMSSQLSSKIHQGLKGTVVTYSSSGQSGRQDSTLDQLKKNTGIDISVFEGEKRQITSIKTKEGKRITGTSAEADVVAKVFKNGEEYYGTTTKIEGQKYYTYYMPLKTADGIIGMIEGAQLASEVDAAVRNVNLISTAVILGLTALLAIVMFFMIRRIVGAIAGAENTINSVAQGDLTVQISDVKLARKDEIGSMMNRLNELTGSLRQVLSEVKETSEIINNHGIELEKMADQTSTTSEEINRAVEGVSSGAVSQAEDTARATEYVVKIGDMIEDITNHIETLDQSSDVMKQADEKSDVMIRELSASNDKTYNAVQAIAEHVIETNNSVKTINDAVVMISNIAEQTNLLSLNASIEAARAGEHGRGFSVVATEIQKLADQSNQSAKKIQGIISDLQKASQQTVTIMEEAQAVINEQQEKLNDTKSCLEEVTNGINSSKENITGIRGEIQTLNDERKNILDVITSLSAISEENAASSEETTASMVELSSTINLVSDAAVELKKLSVTLVESMEYFKL